MKKLVFIFMLLPLLAVAQESTTEIQNTLTQNSSLVEQFAQLAPMGINPYATVFLTSLCAKLGFHNAFVASNPFFNNWFVLILFGVLFLFTASVGTIFKTNKVTAPIALADNYLSDHAALLINGFVMLAPTFFTTTPIDGEIVYQAGFLSVTFKTALILMTSMYFLVIVMSVRFFVDILIFLSPIPLVDTVLEVSKIVTTICFVLISIVAPMASVVISVLMFLIALVFYKRSVRLVNKTKYLMIYPILNMFRNKNTVLTNGESVSILTYVAKKTAKMKKGAIVRLEQQDGTFYLIRHRFLLPNVKEDIVFTDWTLTQNHLNIHLSNKTESMLLVLNRSYHRYIDELAEMMGIEVAKREGQESDSNKGFMSKLKGMFSKKDIAELKSV